MASKSTYELEVRLGATTSASWKVNLKKAEEGLTSLNSLSNRIMAGMAAGVTAAAATATYALSNALDTYTGFEQEMATVQSISGASATQFLAMKDAAMEAGRSTVFTASESASALEYMSLAGWDASQSIAGLMPILELAAATGKELQTTSDLVTDSMSALGIEVEYLDTYLDKLVASNNEANTSAEELMEALVDSGGASRTLGASLDDTITSLGILADNGTKGAEAGRALNSIFVRLAGNAQAIKELDKLGVNIWDDSGNFIGFQESLEQISGAMSKLTAEERALSQKKIAGTNYYSQMAYLLDAVKETTEDGTSAWEELETQVVNSSGALGNMYAIATDTLENAQKTLESAKEDMQIRLVDVFSDDAKGFVYWLAEELPNATDSIVAFAEAHKGEFADALEKLGEGIEFLWENGITAGQWLIKHKSAIVGGIKGIAVSIGLVKLAMTGCKIAELFTNPLSAVGTVAGLAVTAIGAVAGAIKDANEAAVNANLAEHFGDIALSMEDIEEAASYIVGSENLTGVLNALEEFGELDGLSETMEDAVSTLEKLNWKVSIGMELTEAEKEEYQSAIDNFVTAAQEYALQAQYSVSLNMSLAFDENDLEQSNLVSKVNQFYADKYDELAGLGTQLNEAVTNAFNDGFLEIKKIDAIANLQMQMADIEKELAVGEYEAKLSALSLEYSGKELDADTFEKLQEKLNEQLEEMTAARREAYVKNYSAVTASYKGGYLTDEEYNDAIESLKEDLANGIAEDQTRVFQFQVNTIAENYAEEIEGYQQTVEDVLDKYSSEEYDSAWKDKQGLMWENVMNEVTENGPDKATRLAIAELLEPMESSIQEMYNLKNEWDSLSPEMQTSVQEILDTLDLIQGISTDYGEGSIANKIIGSEEYAGTNLRGWVDQNYEELTGYAMTSTAASIEESLDAAQNETVQPAIDRMYADSQAYLGEVFSQGLSASAQLDLTLTPKVAMTGVFTELQDKASPEVRFRNVFRNAEGGIYTSPILTTFAEEGPEAAVPLDGSQRAKNLWVQAGQILGMLPEGTRDREILAGVSGTSGDAGTGRSIQVSYNPVITIQGSASKEEVQTALSLSLDELKEMIKEIQEEDRRVAF